MNEKQKSILTYRQLAEFLIQKGLIAEVEKLEEQLKAIGYFRLKIYLFLFQQDDIGNYVKGTTLDEFLEIYSFDEELRLIVFEAIAKIEVAVRSQTIYEFLHACNDELGYRDSFNLIGLSPTEHQKFLISIDNRVAINGGKLVENYKLDPKRGAVPLWAMAEFMDMGNLLKFYRGVSPEIRERIASYFNLISHPALKKDYLYNWLRSLIIVRNRCAHHNRLWNHKLAFIPKYLQQKRHPEWPSREILTNRKCGFILFMCRFLLRPIDLNGNWSKKVDALFERYPNIPIGEMGLFADWQKHPAWSKPIRQVL